MSDNIGQFLESYWDITNYGWWCIDDDDEDGYYCKEFADALHDFFDDLLDYLSDFFALEETSPDDLFASLAAAADIDNYAELYHEVADIDLERKYGIVTGYQDIDFEEIMSSMENMVNDLLSIDWDSDDE